MERRLDPPHDSTLYPRDRASSPPMRAHRPSCATASHRAVRVCPSPSSTKRTGTNPNSEPVMSAGHKVASPFLPNPEFSDRMPSHRLQNLPFFGSLPLPSWLNRPPSLGVCPHLLSRFLRNPQRSLGVRHSRPWRSYPPSHRPRSRISPWPE